jgi:hypothetical protein
MISFFKVFVYALFPPAALLLMLLLLPFPQRVARAVIQLCDAFLFLQPHPQVPLSLFWIVFGISSLTFSVHMDELVRIQKEYRGFQQERFEDRNRLQVKLLAEERNCWISGCCLTLWLGVHRYRSLLKKYYKLEDERAELFAQSKRDRPAVAIPVAQVAANAPAEVKKDQ